jgi:hypothetical protein
MNQAGSNIMHSWGRNQFGEFTGYAHSIIPFYTVLSGGTTWTQTGFTENRIHEMVDHEGVHWQYVDLVTSNLAAGYSTIYGYALFAGGESSGHIQTNESRGTFYIKRVVSIVRHVYTVGGVGTSGIWVPAAQVEVSGSPYTVFTAPKQPWGIP